MKFGIVGYGNLGRALASALLGTGDVGVWDIHVCDKSEDALSIAASEGFPTYPIERINQMLNDVDAVCLVVKGHVFEEMSKTIDKKALKDKLVISFMAAMTIEKVASLLEFAQHTGDIGHAREGEGIVFMAPVIARAMPSLAIAKNDGIIAYTKLPDAVASIFDKFGFAFETEPVNIDRVTAFASCGLGFASYLIDAFKTAGQAMGFPPETAGLIASLTFKNACDIGNFSQTVKAVATPGGATEQGVNHMDNCGVYGIVAEAMQKSYNKLI